MSKLKIAIIGCGGIANGKHMPALKVQSDRVEMVAFCDLVIERAQEAAKNFGTSDAKVYTDYRELLEDKSIDVVHVCTPNRSHCESRLPLSRPEMSCESRWQNVADAQKMLDAAKKTGKKLTIDIKTVIAPTACF